jgi:uncharacterized protein YxjI
VLPPLARVASVSTPVFESDRFVIEQLIRPIANLYKISSDGRPVAFVRQKKLAIREDLRFFADEGETRELFRIKARSVFEVRGTYDVTDSMDGPIGALQKEFVTSLARSTWRVLDASGALTAVAREQNLLVALVRRVVDLPLPFHFDISGADGAQLGTLRRAFSIRDRYELDLTGDSGRLLDRRLAIALAVGLDALQSR